MALTGSTSLCAFGIWRTGLFATSAWSDPRGALYGATTVAVALLVSHALARLVRRDTSFVVVAGALVLTACFAGLGATAAVSLQLAAGFCIGRRLYVAGPGDDSVAAHAAIATACGLAVLSFVVGALSFLPLNNPSTYLLLLALPIASDWRGNRAAGRDILQAWAAPAPVPADRFTLLLLGTVAFALVLRLLAVLQPETGSDALAMHLVVADQLELHGRFHYDVTQSIWSLMPLAGDWQFAIADMLGGQHAAKLLNYAIHALVVLLVHEHASRAWGRLAGAAAAALYATTPLLHLVTASLFIENPWTLWCVAALLAGLRSLQSSRVRDAVTTGLLLGTALAAKVFTLFMAPFFLAIAVGWLRSRRRGLRALSAFAAAAAIAAGVPYVNAWWRTGNPVFPFMNGVFKSPYFDATQSFDIGRYSHPAGWGTLYEATFETSRYLEALPGALGIALLALLPAAMVFALLDRWRLRLGALFALAFVVSVFQFQAYLRYVTPMVPVFAVMMGGAVALLTVGRPASVRIPVLAITMACCLAGVFLTPTATFRHLDIALPVHAGSEAEERYLARYRPEQKLARVVDAMQLDRVLWLGGPYFAGADTDVFATNWHGGHVLVAEFLALDSARSLQDWIARHKFRAIALAADANPCARPFVCDFLADKATKVYEDGPVALYLPDMDILFDRELLRNGGFERGIESWQGAGEYLAPDGAVAVSAVKGLNQAVPATPGASYALEVEGRCGAQGGSFRSQVNWLDQTGGFIATNIAVFECSPDFVSHASVVTAPKQAATAVVYATGQLPDKTAEITRLSFRQ